MDLKLFKQDIDELINEFAQCDSRYFSEFKRVWLSRKFSYIFEASPTTNQGFFMQSLYAHSISYMVSSGSLSNRLGGFYCLYCLFETQPFKPPFKIYSSLGELKQLKNLVVDAKAAGVNVVAALMKIMLERNMFLFGSVGENEGSATKRVNELTEVQNTLVQTAYNKLLASSRLEHFIHMDMGRELDVDLFKKRSSEYAAAKELAIKEASKVVDVENIKHIAETQLGNVVEKTTADWESQKELLYQQTGFNHLAVAEQEEDENPMRSKKRKAAAAARDGDLGQAEGTEKLEEQEDPEEFCKELEETLLIQTLGSDDEEDEGESDSDEWLKALMEQ